jgi:hypothetical protein
LHGLFISALRQMIAPTILRRLGSVSTLHTSASEHQVVRDGSEQHLLLPSAGANRSQALAKVPFPAAPKPSSHSRRKMIPSPAPHDVAPSIRCCFSRGSAPAISGRSSPTPGTIRRRTIESRGWT